MKNFAPALSLLLMCSVEAAHASPITFEAEYTTLFNRTCFSHAGCFSFPDPPLTRTFTLDSAQLGIDGVYDVTASLDPSPIFIPAAGSTFTIFLTADAIVANNQVLDLVIDFLETTQRNVGPSGAIQTSNSLDAAAGIWSSARSSSDPFGLGSSSESSGTYTVRQVPVPEPGTLLLLSAGVILGRLHRRRAKLNVL